MIVLISPSNRAISYQNTPSEKSLNNQQNWLANRPSNLIKQTRTQPKVKRYTISRPIFSELAYVQRQSQQSSSQTQQNKSQVNFYCQNNDLVPIKRIQSEDVQFQRKANKFQTANKPIQSYNKSKQNIKAKVLQFFKQKLKSINFIQQSAKNKAKQLIVCYNHSLTNIQNQSIFQQSYFNQIQKITQLKSKTKKLNKQTQNSKIQQLQRNIKCLLMFNKLVLNQYKQINKTGILKTEQSSIMSKLKNYSQICLTFQNKFNTISKRATQINKSKFLKNQKGAGWQQIQLSSTSSDQKQSNFIQQQNKPQILCHKQLKDKCILLKEISIKLNEIKNQKFQYQFQEEPESQKLFSENNEEDEGFEMNFSVFSKTISNHSMSKSKTNTIQKKDFEIIQLNELNQDQVQNLPKNQSNSYKKKSKTLILKNNQNYEEKNFDSLNTLKYSKRETSRSIKLANQKQLLTSKNFKMTSSTINNNYQDIHKAEVYQRVLNQPNIGIKQFFQQNKHLEIEQQLHFASKNFLKSHKSLKYKKSQRQVVNGNKQKMQGEFSYRNSHKMQEYPLIYKPNQSKHNQIEKQNPDFSQKEILILPFRKTNEQNVKQQNTKIRNQNLFNRQIQEKNNVLNSEEQKYKNKTDFFKQKIKGSPQSQNKKPQIEIKKTQVNQKKEDNFQNNNNLNIFQKIKPVLQKNIFGNNSNVIPKFGQQSNRFMQNNNQNSSSNLMSFNPNEVKFQVNGNNQSFKSFGNIVNNPFINGNSSLRINSHIFGNSSTNPLNVLASQQISGGNIFGDMNSNKMMNVNPALLQPRK